MNSALNNSFNPSLRAAMHAAIGRIGACFAPFGLSELALDDALTALNPLWSLNRSYARVVQRQLQTPSSCSLVLRVGTSFKGMRSGQHVMLGVQINGVWQRRAYSPHWVNRRKRLLAVTVQRQAQGLVSNWIHDHVQLGEVVELSQAAGDFVLPDPLPQQLLMIAGGSGITPLRAMLDELRHTAAATAVTLIYFAPQRSERIFADALESMSSAWSNFRYLPIDRARAVQPQPQLEPVADRSGALSRTLLDRALPGWTATAAYCCGPRDLMDAARQIWRSAGAIERLHLESFAPLHIPAAGWDAEPARYQVRVKRDCQDASFESDPQLSLLQAAERRGLSLPHGCRQGICHSCSCKLNSGAVLDLQTGQRHQGQGQYIRVCMTTALTDLSLEIAP